MYSTSSCGILEHTAQHRIVLDGTLGPDLSQADSQPVNMASVPGHLPDSERNLIRHKQEVQSRAALPFGRTAPDSTYCTMWFWKMLQPGQNPCWHSAGLMMYCLVLRLTASTNAMSWLGAKAAAKKIHCSAWPSQGCGGERGAGGKRW